MKEINKICPFLGMADDPATNTSFPSFWNHCHYAKPVEAVNFTHQNEYCLSENYIKCPVLRRKEKTPLPAQFRIPRRHFGKKRAMNWKIILLVLIIVTIFIFAVFRFLLQGQIIPKAGTFPPWATEIEITAQTQVAGEAVTPTPLNHPTEAESDSANNAALSQMTLTAMGFTASPLSTAISTLSPTKTFLATQASTLTSSPTTTPIPIRRTLDSPIGTEQKFIIHQVKSSENLNHYATTYKTSVEAILRVNYSLAIPLWVDTLVIIPVDFSSVAQLPYFQPYRITADGITIETMAIELGTGLNDFIYYNDFKSGERLELGDWILVPRLESTK